MVLSNFRTRQSCPESSSAPLPLFFGKALVHRRVRVGEVCVCCFRLGLLGQPQLPGALGEELFCSDVACCWSFLCLRNFELPAECMATMDLQGRGALQVIFLVLSFYSPAGLFFLPWMSISRAR